MLRFGLTILRVTLAIVFVVHGAHILFGFASGPGVGPGGLAESARRFAEAGIEPGNLMALLGGLIQFGGGLLVGLGFLTRYAAAAVLGYVLLAAWKQQLMWGFYLNWVSDATRGQGIEYSLVLAGGLACLLLAGGGALSIDDLRESRAAARAAGRARLRRG
jgi:putative oxidoreductase